LQRTLFSIKIGAAADMRAFSAFAGEEELLVPAGTVFEVLNVKRMARFAAERPGVGGSWVMGGACPRKWMLQACMHESMSASFMICTGEYDARHTGTHRSILHVA
jgi:hypothetical protein